MLRLLGTIEAGPESGRAKVVTAPRLRLILALLGAHAGQRVSVDRLIDALWPDAPPKSAEASIQVHISKIRRIFEPDLAPRAESRFVRYEPAAYLLEIPRDQFDVTAFVDRAESDGETALTTSEALAMWSDPPFAEFADESWAIGAATELRRKHLTVAKRHYDDAIERGAAGEVVDALRSDVAAHPFEERLTMSLMSALYQLNDQRGALDAVSTLRRHLREDLGLDPTPEVRALEHRILTHDPAFGTQSNSVHRRTGAAPERTPMLGREADLERLREALDAHRLVTLTGSGGVGKSRLAHAVVDTTDGARFIDLSTVATAQEAASRIATELDADGDPLTGRVSSLARTMADDATLIVLDNCEQLGADFAEMVDELVAGSGTCRILVTSQRSLGVISEHLVRLAPFELPVDTNAVDIARHPGIRLLCAGGGIEPTVARAHDLVRLHNRLDGLPLALRLAGVRLRSMSVDDVMELGDQSLLAEPIGLPERHRSLDALLSSSIDALSAFQQELLDAFAIFAGAVPLDAAVRLMADKAEPVEVRVGMAELVDRNLVTMSTDGPVSYHMLETVRSHCRERLADTGRARELAQRHARLIRRTALDAVTGAATSLDLDVLHDDVAAALDRAERSPGDPRRDIGLVTAVATAWYGTGRVPEACARLRTVLGAHADGDAVSVGTASALLGMISFDTGAFNDLAHFTGAALRLLEPIGAPNLDFLRAGRHVGRGELGAAREAASRALDDPHTRGRQRLAALEIAANIDWFDGDHEAAADHFTAQLDTARHSGDTYFEGHALRGQAMMRALLGAPEAGLELCRRADELGDSGRVARVISERHGAVALIRFTMGDLATARGAARAVLDHSVHRFDAHAVAVATPIAVACALDDSDTASVARLSGWFDGLCGATGLYAPSASRRVLDDAVTEAQARTPPPEWAAARADGAAFGLAAALQPTPT